MQCYGQFGIFVSQINLAFRSISLPAILTYFLVCNIFGTYLTVSLKSQLFRHMGFVLFPFTMMGSTVGIIALGTFAGLVHKRSIECGSKLKRAAQLFQGNSNKNTLRILQRRAKSLGPLKVRFATNFMEIMTPLVMIGFCAKTTVRMLLVF